MPPAYICQGVRTPIGRYAGALSPVRADDLAAHTLATLRAKYSESDFSTVDEVILGCANQSGEDNRNVARMALLLAGIPHTVPGVTVNRLCASGMEAVASAARGIGIGEISLAIAGGVESMSRAPFVMGKATAPFARDAQMFDTTLGWRFINPVMQAKYGTDSMAETAENVSEDYKIDRASQDKFALWSQQKAAAAQKAGFFAEEIAPVIIPGAKGTSKTVCDDEHLRPDTTLEALAKLPTPFRKGGTVTAGNASGINDGACALFVASEEAAAKFGLTPLARVVGAAAAGVEPRVMGVGPIPAIQRLLARVKMSIDEIDILELNEAFAAQAVAVTRAFGLPDDSEKVNPNGGAIALGHPLGMSGARLILTATHQLQKTGQRYAIASMCIGVGQGMATLLERV
ncbi:MAG TPA: 3-oxoadipyl-CoA thiolase [Bryobacteraceae bacterium]|nr:3-oxoadipyl-CoA thiolase [Bryobacteraceae bacterium]